MGWQKQVLNRDNKLTGGEWCNNMKNNKYKEQERNFKIISLKIEQAVYLNDRGLLPGGSRVFWALVIAVGFVLFVCSFIPTVAYRSSFILSWLGGIVAAAGVFILIKYKDFAKYKDWDTYLADLLATYDPVDTLAYTILQSSVKAAGFVSSDLAKWMVAEHNAIYQLSAEGQRALASKSRFLQRKVE